MDRRRTEGQIQTDRQKPNLLHHLPAITEMRLKSRSKWRETGNTAQLGLPGGRYLACTAFGREKDPEVGAPERPEIRDASSQ